MLRALAVLLMLPLAPAQDPGQAAPKPETLELWPEGAPGALGDAPKDKPAITVYHVPQQRRPHPAVVICPGGGYGHLAKDHEGQQIARWLNTLGIAGVVLDYRHRGKGYGHPAPLVDVQRALRLVRAKAGAWNIHVGKIGVIGFSAGGHLASSVSVHHDDGDLQAKDPVEQQSCRPDFAILCYAVLAFGQDFTHKGSQRNLLGRDADPELVAKMSSERQVNAQTPPTFLWHTSADRVVPPQNSVAYYLALQKHKVPCEMHIFEAGRHGVGLGKGLAAERWTTLCQRWLVTRGVLRR